MEEKINLSKEDRLERLADIQWFLKALDQWAVNPSQYRKAHQTSILSGLSIVRTQLNTLIADAKEQE